MESLSVPWSTVTLVPADPWQREMNLVTDTCVTGMIRSKPWCPCHHHLSCVLRDFFMVELDPCVTDTCVTALMSMSPSPVVCFERLLHGVRLLCNWHLCHWHDYFKALMSMSPSPVVCFERLLHGWVDTCVIGIIISKPWCPCHHHLLCVFRDLFVALDPHVKKECITRREPCD